MYTICSEILVDEIQTPVVNQSHCLMLILILFSGKFDTKSIIGHALYGIALFLKTTEVELI